jgi:hypothetical protein
VRGRNLHSVAAAAAALIVCAAPAHAASLFDGPGPRPGPDILYADAPPAPQLENTGDWKAPPILVSGATAYRDGEFLYQDFLYDDHGGRFSRDQNDERSGDDTFSESNGTYRYPTGPGYEQNAADLVEFRVKPVAGATLFRLTLNTMTDPTLAAATIAIGDSPAPLPMPDGANASVPAQYFLTWHGGTAVLRDAVTGVAITPAPAVTVDQERRQIQISVPDAAWNPGTSTVKMAAGVGLWDKASDRYAQPQTSATADTPGGAAPGAPAFFNVAFRTAEPIPDVKNTAELLGDPSWWRDRQQGNQLRAGSLSQFRADVDFGKLAAGTTDDSAVPQAGPINRIVASHFETKQGVDFGYSCGQSTECKGELRGRLQPYSIYVPTKQGPNGYGFTLALHSLGANFNQFSGSRNQSQWGERGSGSIVATPEGRGPDGWYYDQAGADTFEVWADIARHYRLDPDYTSLGGYSMGGYGTYKFATQFPDLFARAQPTVGPPGLGVAVDPRQPSPGGPSSSTTPMLPSLRNIPIMMWVAVSDELVPFTSTQLHTRALDDLDYRYEFWAFAPAEHLTLASVDQYEPSAAFLGDVHVDRNPAHVTYVRNPKMDFEGDGTKADHAYWLSGIEVADGSGASPFGTIDVRSEGFGTGDPAAGDTQADAGALTGGNIPSIGYQRQRKEWGATPRAAQADHLVIDAKNVASVTIDPQRARVSCAAQLAVTTDAPLTVTLAGCRNGKQSFGAAAACGAKGLPRASVSRGSLKASRRRALTSSGRAIAFRCVSNRRRPGKVGRVEVSIARKSGRRCRHLNRRGTLGRTQSCGKNDWLRARLGRQRGGKVSWTFTSRRKLPRGSYVLVVRAVDSTGTVDHAVRKQGRKTFRVR